MYEIKLSPYAKIFYIEWLLDPGGSRYNVSYVQTLYGKLDEERLRKALIRYVDGYLLLNSHVQEIAGEPYWVKNDSVNELEYSSHPVSNSELLNYVTNSFDLYSGPLYRFKLVRVSDNIHKFIVVLHHLVMDGSSLDFGVFEAISNYYNDAHYAVKHSIDEQINLVTNLTNTLSIKLQQNQFQHEEFWRKQLSGIENVDLSFLKTYKDCDEKNAEEPYNPIEEIRFDYGEHELAKLSQIKTKYSVTPYIYGQCIFALLLHKFASQERLAISYPGAIKEGIDFIYGAQLNINLVPYAFNPATTIAELLNQSREFFHTIKQEEVKYSYYPITALFYSNTSIDRRLLNISFIQAPFRDKPFEFEGITGVEVLTEFNVDSVPKEMLLFEQEIKLRNNKLNYRVRYDKRTIDRELLNNFVTTYKRIFLEVLEDLSQGKVDRLVSDYSLLDEQEYHKIVYEFNQTDKDYPRDKTIHQLFEEQVQRTPNNVAVVYEDVKLTYQQLNQKANQLAHYLRDNYDIKPDDLVVLCLDRSEYIIIAILAVLKAGGAYVPIEPNYPDERISYVLRDTRARVIFAIYADKHKIQNILLNQASKNIDAIFIDEETIKSKLDKQNNANPSVYTSSDDLMYVIYTSGTTGNPKGVMIEHRSVVNYVMYLIKEANVSNKSIGSKYAALSFDASVTELYPILLSGGALFIVQDKIRLEPIKINEFFNKNHITYAFLPTKIAELFFRLHNNSLVTLIVGGEKLEKFTDSYKVLNAYGPTETTVQPTNFVVDKAYDNIPIGKPINNVKCYVVDNSLHVLPIGIIGELMIGGECLARGYQNNQSLTQEKFIPNPFQTEKEKLQDKNSRLYKTGDLVRMLPDGNLEYIGRNDFQVKIRGYRIELGEIESKLLHYPDVKQAIVVVRKCANSFSHDTNDKYLAAYYVADKKINEVKLYDYLMQQLPEYMLPSVLVHLDKLPLTTNGKIDRTALPEPRFESSMQYLAPKNEQEKLICAAFAKVLGVENIGVNDDFFKLGGNSLKAISLTSNLQANFDIKVADIFNLRTPLKLAEHIYFGRNMLQQKLALVKMSYKNKQKRKATVDEQLQNKVNHYLENLKNLPENYSLQKPMTNVLLTGATGYLGCNILNQLLRKTNYKIFLLVRADSQRKALNRINRKFQFYFDKSLDDFYDTRVFVFNADLEKNDLGLPPQEYKTLSKKIDSVIHAAALVKHYGERDKFYSANVQATINLLEFTKATKSKNFHYISTYSVLNCGFVPNRDEYTYTEDDLPDNLQQWDNIYIQTKLQGEQQTIKYRNYGVKTNIYRVGNLAFMAENYRAQENVEDNAFFNWLKCLFKMKCVAKDLNLVEISPVDFTAQAIVELFDKKGLENSVYHVFNPCLFDISSVFADSARSPVASLTMEQFVDNIVSNLSNNIYHDLIVRFLLHQGWLDGWNIQNTTSITVLQDRTKYILKSLGFEWPSITSEIFNKYLELLKLYGVNEMTKKAKILEHLEKVAQDIPAIFYWLDTKQRYLGANKHCVKISGATSYEKDFAGKTPYDLYPKEMAENMVQHHKKVVSSGKTLSVEESIKDITTGEIKYFNGTVSPLYDDDGEMLGTIGTAIDITAEKKEMERLKKAKIFENLEKIAQLSPVPFYWLDLNQKYLGVNKYCIRAIGATSYEKDFAGKTPYDLYPKEMAKDIVQHHKDVIKNGEIYAVEESIKDVTTGEIKYFNATISPLRDDDDKIIGTIGISVDITAAKKEAERLKIAKVFEHLDKIAQIIPTPIYWLDTNGVILGINDLVLKGTGTPTYDDFVGKTPYDLYPKEMAEEIARHHKEVIQTGKMLVAEESIKDITTGKIKCFNAFIAPLCDDNGSIIGTIGTSIETTAEKEAERLRAEHLRAESEAERLNLENEAQKAKLIEEEKFRRTANQVVHDMGTPLASLRMIMTSCIKDIPEKTRIVLRDVMNELEEVSNDLLSKYRKKDPAGKETGEGQPQAIMVSLALQQLLVEKRYQYQDLPLQFISDFTPQSNFAFINIEPSAFKRMISNLLNNAVDALEGKEGEVKVMLNASHEKVRITIQDNGKGMPQEVLDKIKKNVAITSGKKGGHGIGFTQISDTLRRNNVKIGITSKVGKGTKITLTFSRHAAPLWVSEELVFYIGDTLIILDDDSSIHRAWDMRLQPWISAESIKVRHFTSGSEAISFIKKFAKKDELFLLTDYELLKQELNGINVVEKTKLKRSLLVTSHHTNPVVQELALKANIKMLPKQLASEIPIKVMKDDPLAGGLVEDDPFLETRRVDIVMIESDRTLARILAGVLRHMGKKVDVYNDVMAFFANLDKYDKDTVICTDFTMPNMNGKEVTTRLHDAGYTKLYINTGWAPFNVKEFDIPDYVTVMYKSNDSDENLKKLVDAA